MTEVANLEPIERGSAADTSLGLASRSRLLSRLASLGVRPDDTEEERLAKAVITLSACLITGLSTVWVITYLALGLRFSAAIPFAYQVVTIVSLIVFSRTGGSDRSAPVSSP